uniref:Kinesin motor domain-containing protein n=1 Tax=Syphacia muris TaxID=451379 RepID=A0A0N5A8U5_9BILA
TRNSNGNSNNNNNNNVTISRIVLNINKISKKLQNSKTFIHINKCIQLVQNDGITHINNRKSKNSSNNNNNDKNNCSSNNNNSYKIKTAQTNNENKKPIKP